MLKMRLQRVGRVHEPSFRLVLTDSKNSTRSGRFNEILGSYDPRKMTDALDAERIKYWLSQGANPTPTVHNLLVRHRIITAKKINVAAKSKKAPVAPVVEQVQTAQIPVNEPLETAAPNEVVPAVDAIIEPVVEEKAEESASTEDVSEAKEETV